MVCKPLGPKEVLFRAIRMNYMELKRFCKKLRGNITVMDPNADFKRLRDSGTYNTSKRRRFKDPVACFRSQI